MQSMIPFIALVRTRVVAFARALNAALSEPAPHETDGFGRGDDDSVFQPLGARARANRDANASSPNAGF